MSFETMSQTFVMPPLGRAFWKDSLDEKHYASSRASVLLDGTVCDKWTAFLFTDDFWTEALDDDRLHLQGPSEHHSELQHEIEMLITFGFPVQPEHQVLSIYNAFLLFPTPGDFHSHYLVSIGNCYKFRVSLETSTFKLLWTSISHRTIDLYLFTYVKRWTHTLLLRTSFIMKCKIVLSIELQGAETQAGKTSCEGSATGHIWLALQRVENLPEARQHLLLRSLSYLESICQQNFYFLLGVNRAKSSSSECGGRRFSGRTAGDISQGRDCEDCTYNTGGPSKRGTRDDKGNSQQLQRPSTWPYRSRQKRSATSAGLPEDNGDDGSSDGDPHKRRRVESEKNMKFACPFFKHSPDKFIGERSCCGPGWVNVQRVKEHIFRKHRAPDFQCARCFTEFEQRSQLDGHTRSTVACEVRDRPSALPHVDEMTMQLLKQRRKSASPLTEKDKWYTVYKIIFPDDTQIPSPYYELDEKMHTKLTKGGAEEIFRDHLKETLPLDTLTDLGLIDGVMAAFSMTLSTLNGPRSTEISDDTRQSATTSTRSWPENGRYEATQSSSQIDNTAKDDPVHLWTPLSNIDSASHVPKDTEHAHIILPDLDISGFLRQVPPDNGFPVKTHDDGWDFGDGQLAFTGIFHGSELEPSFEYGYIDSEKPSSDRIGSEEQSKD